MRCYKVGKTDKYAEYVLETLRVMYGAGVTHFTIRDVCVWGGIGYSMALRHLLDRFALDGLISVDFSPKPSKKRPRSYNLNTVAFFGSIELD